MTEPVLRPSSMALNFRMWIEGDEEENEKEGGRKKVHAKLVKARTGAQGKGDPLIGLSRSPKPPTTTTGMGLGRILIEADKQIWIYIKIYRHIYRNKLIDVGIYMNK